MYGIISYQDLEDVIPKLRIRRQREEIETVGSSSSGSEDTKRQKALKKWHVVESNQVNHSSSDSEETKQNREEWRLCLMHSRSEVQSPESSQENKPEKEITREPFTRESIWKECWTDSE